MTSASDRIALPEGFFPEGIAAGSGSTFFVGSLADGTIYRGDFDTGAGEVLSAPTGPFATVGLDVDARGRVWAAGGPTGTAKVYDGTSGELLAEYQLTEPFASFINDVIVTDDGAWFTDAGTQNSPDPAANQFAGTPRLFNVPLGPDGSLPVAEAVQELVVDIPDTEFPNLNGIVTAPDGESLLIAHTSLGALFNVDPGDGSSTRVELPRSLNNPDGMARVDRMLFVVEPGARQVSHIRLDAAGSEGAEVLVSALERAETPTTVAAYGDHLFIVDARFLSQAGPYEITRVPRG